MKKNHRNRKYSHRNMVLEKIIFPLKIAKSSQLPIEYPPRFPMTGGHGSSSCLAKDAPGSYQHSRIAHTTRAWLVVVLELFESRIMARVQCNLHE